MYINYIASFYIYSLYEHISTMTSHPLSTDDHINNLSSIFLLTAVNVHYRKTTTQRGRVY